MSNQQPHPLAPPAYSTVAPPTAPPSYNPEYMVNNDTTYTQPPNTQPTSTDYNTGNMYGQPQYQYEGRTVPIIPQHTPTVPPPGNYNNYTQQTNPPTMNQPLVSVGKTPFSVSSISSSFHRKYYKSDYASSDQCKKCVLYGGICWCVALILLCIGGVMLDDNLQFQKEATETRCSIVSYTQSTCSYDCNCYTDHNDQRQCNTCWGSQYEYYAKSNACGYYNRTLYQHSYDENGACPQDFKGIGYNARCWVVCNESTFSFSSPQELVAWSIVLLAIGGCCCVGGSTFSCKFACCD